MSGISVHVRVRPTSHQSSWATADTALFPAGQQLGGQETAAPFVFNKVHSAAATNVSIFHSVEPLVHAAFDGRNVTVMAYGQTGSGKTHTMVGGLDEHGAQDLGIIPRVAQLLLRLKDSSSEGTSIEASCVEIYNEKVQDLMNGKAEINLQDNAIDGSVSFRRVGIPINVYQDYEDMSRQYENARAKNVTDMNAHSSRSHMMLCFTIQRPNKAPSTIYLVDLAGSESASKANTEGAIQREGGFINKSLLALGNVVTALVDGRLPVYRESKLTRLLRGCLSGGFTFLITAVNPDPSNYEQTVTALKFAQRAMKMKTDPTQTVTMVPLEAVEYAHHLKATVEEHKLKRQAAYEQSLHDTYQKIRPLLQEHVSRLDETTLMAAKKWQKAKLLLCAREQLKYVMAMKNLQSRGGQVESRHHEVSERLAAEAAREREAKEKLENLEEIREEYERRVQEKKEQRGQARDDARFAMDEAQAEIYHPLDAVQDEQDAAFAALTEEEAMDFSDLCERFAQFLRGKHDNVDFQVNSVDNARARFEMKKKFQADLEKEENEVMELEVAYDIVKASSIGVTEGSLAGGGATHHQKKDLSLSQATSFAGRSQSATNVDGLGNRGGDDDLYADSDEFQGTEAFNAKVMELVNQKEFLEEELRERASTNVALHHHSAMKNYNTAGLSSRTPPQKSPFSRFNNNKQPTPAPNLSSPTSDRNNQRSINKSPIAQQRSNPRDHQQQQSYHQDPMLAIKNKNNARTSGGRSQQQQQHDESNNDLGGDVSLYLEDDTPPQPSRRQPHQQQISGPGVHSANRSGTKRDLLAAARSMNEFQQSNVQATSSLGATNGASRFNQQHSSKSRSQVMPSASRNIPPPPSRSPLGKSPKQNLGSSPASKMMPAASSNALVIYGSHQEQQHGGGGDDSFEANRPSNNEENLMIGYKRANDLKEPSPPSGDQGSMTKAELQALKRKEAARKAQETRARNKAEKDRLAAEKARARRERQDRAADSRKTKSLSNSPTPATLFGTPSSAQKKLSVGGARIRDTDNVTRSLEFN